MNPSRGEGSESNTSISLGELQMTTCTALAGTKAGHSKTAMPILDKERV